MTNRVHNIRTLTVGDNSEASMAIPGITNFLWKIPTSATSELWITMKDKVVAGLVDGITITFADAGSPDTITRDKGSWFDDGFVDDMLLTITGTTTNDGSFTIDTVTDKVITLVGGDTLTDQTTTDAVIEGLTPDANWTLYKSSGTDDVYEVMEFAPTGIKVKKTNALGADVILTAKG